MTENEHPSWDYICHCMDMASALVAQVPDEFVEEGHKDAFKDAAGMQGGDGVRTPPKIALMLDLVNRMHDGLGISPNAPAAALIGAEHWLRGAYAAALSRATTIAMAVVCDCPDDDVLAIRCLQAASAMERAADPFRGGAKKAWDGVTKAMGYAGNHGREDAVGRLRVAQMYLGLLY